jgi:gamma-glutamylcyclotransferase
MDKDDGKEWYFAYGSNLCVEQMVRRTGPLDEKENRAPIARLPGYRLAFNMQGDDGHVYANIMQPGDGVIGVLYHCGAAALASLDVYEEGYDRRQVLVTLENGATRQVMAYIARPECTTNAGAPSAEYLGIILRGARRHGLPEAYVAAIEGQAQGL